MAERGRGGIEGLVLETGRVSIEIIWYGGAMVYCSC